MMSHRSIATPCPTFGHQADQVTKTLDETTTTLNFTSAFDASFRLAKPKRQQRLSVQFAIHEDHEETREGASLPSRLSKPARRMTGTFPQVQTSTTTSSTDDNLRLPQKFRASRLSQAPKRPQHRLSIVAESKVHELEPESVRKDDTASLGFTIHSARPMRRRTIYIPNDETTMPSMYMGIFSPLKGDSMKEVSDPTLEMNGLAAQMAIKRGYGRRTSIIDAAPRRAPLQTSIRRSEKNALLQDKPGQNGGKENVPPGMSECEKQMLDLSLVGPSPVCLQDTSSAQTQRPQDMRKHSRSSVYAPTKTSSKTSQSRLSMSTTSGRHSIAPRQGGIYDVNPLVRRRASAQYGLQRNTRPISEAVTVVIPAKPRVSSRFVVPVIKTQPVMDLNTVLTDNIANPTLYEDNWLGHQEIAITQLLNKLFVAAQPNRHKSSFSTTLTQELLALYNQNMIAVLHNRIHAALLYGALSISQDILNRSESFTKDIGRKEHFIELWVDTYDKDVLEAGLEVVIGRQCRPQTVRLSDAESPGRSPSRRSLHKFIDTFLLRNEDARPDRTVRNRFAWSYQRTMLRSLMLIKVLDLIKITKQTSFCGPLFQATSPFKSSVAVLQRLFQMMNPAAGDPLRALSHIDYTVSHTQYPLEEFQYNIENLAIDLRDGVRLTRLIELLLYPSASDALEKKFDLDATTTIMMPAGDSVEFLNGQDWPLSQHLKFPSLSRVARLWNVQIALSAAARVKGMETMVDGITATDIVDGYREKTIRLLWALVGKCGLPTLVDWDDVAWETRRLQLRNAQATRFDDQDDHQDDIDPSDRTFETCKSHLKGWVRAIAASQGIELRNFTTSFADGRIFQAIVDTYEPYLHTSGQAMSANQLPQAQVQQETLSDRLTRLGCSKQFAELFSTSEAPHVFDRDFVLAALAFLCSRLLAPTKATRAASVIQTTWRAYWGRIEMQRNQTRKVIAHACAQHTFRQDASRDVAM